MNGPKIPGQVNTGAAGASLENRSYKGNNETQWLLVVHCAISYMGVSRKSKARTRVVGVGVSGLLTAAVVADVTPRIFQPSMLRAFGELEYCQ